MTPDTLNNWEKWPIGALFFAQGLQIAEWYISKRMPAEVVGMLPWFVTIGGIAAMAAIDGAMIAAIMGARAGRRGRWTWAAIGITALFGALVALDLNGALVGIGPWLHAGFAATIAVYLMHLVQPRQDVTSALAAREAQLAHREQAIRQAEQAVAHREQLASVAEQVVTREVVEVATYKLAWKQLEQVVGMAIERDAKSLSSIRRLVAEVGTRETEVIARH